MARMCRRHNGEKCEKCEKCENRGRLQKGQGRESLGGKTGEKPKKLK